MGNNITIDFASASQIYAEYNYPTIVRPTWFDGCQLTNTAGRFHLVAKTARNTSGPLVRGRPIFTEANISNLWNVACGSLLVRGNNFKSCWGDLTNHSDGVIANVIDDFSSSDYRREVPCMTVCYTGPESGASISMDGYNNGARVLTIKMGNNTTSFHIESSIAASSTSQSYNVANVVEWINSLPGWKASLLDDSLRAATIQKMGTVGSWQENILRDYTLTLYCMIDLHPDFNQTWNKENFVISDNILTNSVCQNIFLKDGFCKDAFIVNNSFHNSGSDPLISQLASVHSHVVISHNSSSKQGWIFRTDFSGPAGSTAEKYTPDSYCLFSNNVAPYIAWQGVAVGDMLRDNHLFQGAKTPANSVSTTIEGSEKDLFNNPSAGDFAPKGALLANKRRPILPFDQAGKSRLGLDAVGACSAIT